MQSDLFTLLNEHIAEALNQKNPIILHNNCNFNNFGIRENIMPVLYANIGNPFSY